MCNNTITGNTNKITCICTNYFKKTNVMKEINKREPLPVETMIDSRMHTCAKGEEAQTMQGHMQRHTQR